MRCKLGTVDSSVAWLRRDASYTDRLRVLKVPLGPLAFFPTHTMFRLSPAPKPLSLADVFIIQLPIAFA